MAINIRQKGAGGEREIADALNFIVYTVMKELEIPNPTMSAIQRNQNQSAVGGSDLTGVFDLAVEVKRQEQLSINTWWKQCTDAADRNKQTPILLFRQNGKKWRCVMYAEAALPETEQGYARHMRIRVEMDFEDFKKWFTEWVRCKLLGGYEIAY